MNFIDFSTLVSELYRTANKPTPSYTVIKDLFDCVNIRKDGYIDQAEWNRTFNELAKGDPKNSTKATPLASWENSAESNKIGEAIARNRKALTDAFRKESTHTGTDGRPHYVTLD